MNSDQEHNKTVWQNDLTILQDTVMASQDTTANAMMFQDTSVSVPDSMAETDTVVEPAPPTDSVNVIIPVSSSATREQTISSQRPITGKEPTYDSGINNAINPFNGEALSKENHSLFLRKSLDKFFYVEDSARLVYSTRPDQTYPTEASFDQESFSAQKADQLMKPDWLIGIIIGCLVLFAWLKLFYNKFIDQTFISLWNFQLSENFLRDQSIFSRRVSIMLNLNFIVTAGLFFYLVALFFEINPWKLNPFNIFLASTGIVALLLSVRYIVSHLTGVIFDHHKLFKDYLNQILIIYKIAGVVLIPVIMAIAYFPEEIRIYLIISGLILLAAGFLFRFVKGIQLIFNKDVSIFYMILYLCTLEFLPALVIYKFFSSLV
jgi:hypothetical protein